MGVQLIWGGWGAHARIYTHTDVHELHTHGLDSGIGSLKKISYLGPLHPVEVVSSNKYHRGVFG